MARVDTLGNFLTDVADAIRTKTGSSETIQASDFDTAIENIPSGGSTEVPEKDVNFYDYDGTRVYSYTKAEFLALEELPANPTHQGLTAQGWNWSYQNMIDYVTEYGICDVGQQYITDDGATKVYINIYDDILLKMIVGIKLNGTAKINWGDGSSDETITGSNTQLTLNHTYNNKGNYKISLIPTEDTITLEFNGSGANSRYSNLVFPSSQKVSQKAVVEKIELGEKVRISQGAFGYLTNLKSITIPKNTQGFNGNSYIFYYTNLPIYITPQGSTSLNGNYTSVNTRIITADNSGVGINTPWFFVSTRFIIPESMKDFSYNSISNTGVIGVIIPKSVSTIGQGLSFQNAEYIDFSHHESIPTLKSSNYMNYPQNIIVPDDLYEDWIVAENWSTYASKIISKSDWEAQQ